MKFIVYILETLSRYFISLHNLGIINTFKILVLKFLPSNQVSKIKSNKFGTIHWRSSCDHGVISHLFSPQISIDTNKDIPKIIIDVGANIGIETIRFIKLFPKSKIIAVEPEKNNYEILMQNLNNNENLTAINKAIWNGKYKLSIKNSTSQNSQTFQIEDENKEGNISTLSINDLMEEFGLDGIDILKIDAEGSENKIFDESCDKWLKFVKVIIVECPDNDYPYTSMKIYESFLRNNIKYKTYINGENLVFIRENCNWKPTKISYY